MRNIKHAMNKWIRSALVGLTGGVVILIMGSNTFAQARIETSLQLKTACESNPGNVVSISQSTKIYISNSGGAVNSGCTVVLADGVSLDFENIYLSFAGPLTIQSSGKGDLRFTRSSLDGTSLSISLPGVGGGLGVNVVTLRAMAGNLNINLGDDAKMEISQQNRNGEGLTATGTVQIRGGRKLTASIEGKESHFVMRAPFGISMRMDGDEGLLKMDKILTYAEQGSISFTATGEKSMVEMSSTNHRIADSFVIRLDGRESTIKIKQMFLGTGDGSISTGGLIFESGTGNATGGKIEVSEFSNGDIAFVTMAASRTGQSGSVKVEKSQIGAQMGDLLIETGSQGSTEVKENRLFSETAIRVASGTGGSCSTQNNELFAPLSVICP